MKILIAILILSLLIFVHEFGHFVVAKICGVHVKEFSLGMGPRLLKFKRKDTLYSIKLFLFGGSCAMSGMDENGDETGEGSYLSKSVWKRMAIVVAGATVNIVFVPEIGYSLDKVINTNPEGTDSDEILTSTDFVTIGSHQGITLSNIHHDYRIKVQFVKS